MESSKKSNPRIYCCKEDRHCDEIICCRFCPKYRKNIPYTRKDGSTGTASACYFDCFDAWRKRCKYKCRKGKAETMKLMDKINPKPRPIYIMKHFEELELDERERIR